MIKKYFSQPGRLFFKHKATAVFILCSAVALFVSMALPTWALQTGIEYGEATGLGSQDIRITIMKIVRVVLGFVGIIAMLVILYGGYVWMTSGGSPEKIDEAKRILKNGVIGLVIILSAFAIASFIINALIGATSGQPDVPGGPPPGECENCWYLGGGIIESVYPTPFAREVPRNTSIIVTFKVPMNPATIIQGAPAICTVAEPCLGEINFNNIKIFQYDQGQGTALAADKVRARSVDGKTFVFSPTELLGNALQNTWYSTRLKTGIRKDNNEAAFPSGDFEWRFEIGTLVDIDPVEVSSVFPPPDDQSDSYSFTEAVAARGSLRLLKNPNIAKSANASLTSSTPGTPSLTINGSYNGSYEGLVTLTVGLNRASATWNPARPGAPESFNITNNTITFGDGLILTFATDPAQGNQLVIGLTPQTNADTLRIGSRLYTFVPSSGEADNPLLGPNQIPVYTNALTTLMAIAARIQGDTSLPLTYITGDDDATTRTINLTAKVAGVLGNSILVSASGDWAAISPMSGGENAGLQPRVIGRADQPRNSIISINFNEAINPTMVNNDIVKVEYDRYDGASYQRTAVEGSWVVSNEYKTIEFIPSEICVNEEGQPVANACGDDVYCLPVNNQTPYIATKYFVTIKAGLLRECNQDTDCTESSFSYCVQTPGADQASVCSNVPSDDGESVRAYYPQVRDLPAGIIDVANNTFNGNSNTVVIGSQTIGRAEGPQEQSGRSPFSLNVSNVANGDDFAWSFFVNKSIKLTPPVLESIQPNINQSSVSLTAPIEGQFGDLMMSSTLKPGSNYRDGYCSCSNDSDCASGYSCDSSIAPARCVANDKAAQSYCQQNSECSGSTICLNKKYLSFIDRSTSPIGWWIGKRDIDTKTPPDGFANKTTALLKHTKFNEVTSYGVEVGSGVRDIYQNCYLPSEGPGLSPSTQCNTTVQKPYCCNGVSMSLDEWQVSGCFTKP